MARCQGITKAGAQCKRNAMEGEDYCSIHLRADSPRSTRRESEPEDRTAQADNEVHDDSEPRKKWGSRHVQSGDDFLHLAIGVAIGVAFFWVLRRGTKLPGF